jgi:hypothetical protein
LQVHVSSLRGPRAHQTGARYSRFPALSNGQFGAPGNGQNVMLLSPFAYFFVSWFVFSMFPGLGGKKSVYEAFIIRQFPGLGEMPLADI